MAASHKSEDILIKLCREKKMKGTKVKNTKENGKVAFITGANRGLGLETARELGRQGIVVVLGSRDSKKGEAAAAKLRDEGIMQRVWALM